MKNKIPKSPQFSIYSFVVYLPLLHYIFIIKFITLPLTISPYFHWNFKKLKDHFFKHPDGSFNLTFTKKSTCKFLFNSVVNREKCGKILWIFLIWECFEISRIFFQVFLRIFRAWISFNDLIAISFSWIFTKE